MDAVRDANRLTRRYIQAINSQMVLRAVGLLAMAAAASADTRPLGIGALAVLATLLILLGSWRDARRVNHLTMVSALRREATWHDTAAILARLEHEIEHGPPNALRNEWFRWNWRSPSWWTRQSSDLLSAGSVALAAGLVLGLPALAAVATGAAYLSLLGYLAKYELAVLIAQRQAIRDAIARLRTRRDPAGEFDA